MLITGGLLLLAALAFVLRDSLIKRDAPLVIASVSAIEGDQATRDFANAPNQFRKAERGDTFTLGDALRTGNETYVTLQLADRSELRVMPDTILRFMLDADASGGLNVDLQSGQAVVHSERDLALTTHAGQALVKAGSTIKLDRSGQGLGILVELGGIRLQRPDGGGEWLEDGSNVRVGFGMVVLAPEPEPPADAGADAGDAGDAEVPELDVRAPEEVQLGVPIGESFVVHASELPVAVGFELSKRCAGEAELELSGKRQRLRGRGRIAVLLSQGTRAYTVQCLERAGPRGVVRGSVRVVKDPGTRTLPPRPPTSFVDTDGRAYTVYYPNQLPDILVRWPNPPAEPSYELEIDGKLESVPGPEYLLKSGTLGDGIHQLSFRGSTRRSRTTTVEIRFDNNAPTASLSEPAERGFTPGAEVRVEGVALEGWKVTLPGGTITRHADGRFSGTIAPTAERPDIAVRLAHPGLGVHYYLRRAAVPSP